MPLQPNSRPKTLNNLRVLGVDTSLRSTGLGLVEFNEGQIIGIAYDLIKNPPRRPLSECLLTIRNKMQEVLDESQPDVVAVEGVFYSKFVKTTLILGEARGVVISSCAAAGLAIFEYPPTRVKQAVVGWGGATKDQMQKMVASMLGMASPPPEDAADALAIAICHIQSFRHGELSNAKPL